MTPFAASEAVLVDGAADVGDRARAEAGLAQHRPEEEVHQPRLVLLLDVVRGQVVHRLREVAEAALEFMAHVVPQRRTRDEVADALAPRGLAEPRPDLVADEPAGLVAEGEVPDRVGDFGGSGSWRRPARYDGAAPGILGDDDEGAVGNSRRNAAQAFAELLDELPVIDAAGLVEAESVERVVGLDPERRHAEVELARRERAVWQGSAIAEHARAVICRRGRAPRRGGAGNSARRRAPRAAVAGVVMTTSKLTRMPRWWQRLTKSLRSIGAPMSKSGARRSACRSPSSVSGELLDRHQLDGVDAEVGEPVEMAEDHLVEGAEPELAGNSLPPADIQRSGIS